jgi:hypothetical protein
MLKAVVVFQTVVVGSVSVLLALTSQPSAREQATPMLPSSSAAPTESQTKFEQDAMNDAAQALEALRSTYRCTYALKMTEVDPNFDSKIRANVSNGGDAKIRRIGLPPCPNFQIQVQHRSMGSGQVRITPSQKKHDEGDPTVKK